MGGCLSGISTRQELVPSSSTALPSPAPPSPPTLPYSPIDNPSSRSDRVAGAPHTSLSQAILQQNFDRAGKAQRVHAAKKMVTAHQRLSPSITAKFGIEIEIPSIRVDPAYPRGTVLLERSKWKLETDSLGPGESDLEFVFDPTANQAELSKGLKEITALIQAIRTQAMAGRSVSLMSVSPDARLEATLNVNDLRFGARLQCTYGVALKDLKQSIDELLPVAQATNIARDTTKIAESHHAKTAESLSDNALNFIRLINLYLIRAKSRRSTDGSTVHTYFRMMVRSDFSSIYDKLLSETDRLTIKSLLIASSDNSVPPFMQALSLEADRPVFARPYWDKTRKSLMAGPIVKDWLASIVDGRGEGAYKKDLLSPPAGYALHTGDLSKDYGMGAMGVDEKQGLVLFEIRGAPYRPENISMNGQIEKAVSREFLKASQFNETLEQTAELKQVTGAKYEALGQWEVLYDNIHTIDNTLERLSKTLSEKDWKYIQPNIRDALSKLGEFRRQLLTTKDKRNNAFVASMDVLNAAVIELGRAGEPWHGRTKIFAEIPEFRTALSTFEVELWNAGSR